MNFIFNIRVHCKHYLLFLFLLFIFSCSRKINGEVQGNINTNDNVSESFRFPVIVVKARKGPLSNYITLNGDIDVKVKAEVFPDVTGKIVFLHVKSLELM